MGVPQGNSTSKETAEEAIGIPNHMTVYDETGKEISGFSMEAEEEVIRITQEIKISQGSVEEIMGFPKTIIVSHVTLHEILCS